MSASRRPAEAQIFIIRVYFRNGLLLHYTFYDPARSKQRFDDLVAAKRNREAVQFFDDVGREALHDGADIMAIGNIDLVSEAAGDAEIARVIGALMPQPEQPAGARLPRPGVREPTGDEPSPRGGLIGGGDRFAL